MKIQLLIYIVKQKKLKDFLNEKSVKITKQVHAFKDFAGIYNVEILNSFNSDLQLKILNLQLKIS